MLTTASSKSLRDKIDAAVLERVREDPCDAHHIEATIRGLNLPRGQDAYRHTDRSLQRLRKAGLIEYTGKPRRWRVVEGK